MCIGVPARITAIHDGLMPMGELEVDGATRTCCLAYVPEAAVGDYVIVANGFAMTVVSAADDVDLTEADKKYYEGLVNANRLKGFQQVDVSFERSLKDMEDEYYGSE